MISKNKISEIRKLHSKKFRDERQLFLVEGFKSVEMLCASDFEISEIFATACSAERNDGFLRDREVCLVTEDEMQRISTMQKAPELLAVAQQRKNSPIPDNGPLLALDHISDPGNFGTIIRTADWFGIRHIVCSENCVEFYNPKTIQATMGSFANVVVHETVLDDFLMRQCDHRRVVGTFLDGQPLDDFQFRESDIIVIGNESNGISTQVGKAVTDRITIPRGIAGPNCAESLNAAIAAAIVMHSWTK